MNSSFLALWIIETWQVIAVSSPWLLFGFLFAGLLHVLLPKDFIEKQLSTPGFLSVLKASLFGIPLPLCSCSVIPVATSIRRAGASKGSTASFLVSTPQVGIDSFLLTYALLGPIIAIIRVIASFFTAVVVGMGVDVFDEKTEEIVETQKTSSCCGNEAPAKNKFYEIFHYGFVEIIDDLVVTLMLGFLGAGLIGALVPDDFFTNWALGPIASIFVMLVVSLPLYVCATATTPLAAALLLKGISPGAALILLLAGPATNFATMLVVKKELGKQGLFIYISGIILISIIFCLGLNALMPTATAVLKDHLHNEGLMSFGIAQIIFSFLLIISLCRKVLKSNSKSC